MQRLGAPSPMMVAVIAVPCLLFRAHLLGQGTWIGNPDRLNSNLKILAFLSQYASNGEIPAWNEHEMMGYDVYALPYTFPNPLIFLYGLNGPQGLITAAGYISIVLLILAGLSCALFLRGLGVRGLPLMVGATLYQLTALTVLKVSQNDASFAVLISIPVLLWLVRRLNGSSAAIAFSGMASLLFAMLHGMFLQKVAYAFLLIGTYAAWRSLLTKTWRPLAIFAGAAVAAAVLSSPRIIGIAIAMSQYSRTISDFDPRLFDSMYQFQHIFPREILRWVDPAIFGNSPSEAKSLNNNINLSEGFLLGSTTAVPVLLLIGFIRARGVWFPFVRDTASDTVFWTLILAAAVSVVTWKPALMLLYYGFGRLDFTHARILIIGLPAMMALMALLLSWWQPPLGSKHAYGGLSGILCGVIVAMCIEKVALQQTGTTPLDDLHLFDPDPDALVVTISSLWRAGVTAAAAILLLVGIRATRFNRVWAVSYGGLCALMMTQAFIAADRQVNSSSALQGGTAFNAVDMYMARRDEFVFPDGSQVSALGSRVETVNKRVALVCPPQSAGGFCAGYIPEAWHLRTVDGYYGLGIPKRMRALPWKSQIGLRTISFNALDQLDWKLLGLLNVGAAIIVDQAMYKNRRDGGGPIDPEQIMIVKNPHHVTPRAFLVRKIETVSSAAEAGKKISSAGERVEDISYVEGAMERSEFDDSGKVVVTGSNDRLRIDVSPTGTRRFLVVNELYYPGWRAEVDGIETGILPTNAVMRGVELPPGTRQVVLTYRPFVKTHSAAALYGFGSLLLIAGLWLSTKRRLGAKR